MKFIAIPWRLWYHMFISLVSRLIKSFPLNSSKKTQWWIYDKLCRDPIHNERLWSIIYGLCANLMKELYFYVFRYLLELSISLFQTHYDKRYCVTVCNIIISYISFNISHVNVNSSNSFFLMIIRWWNMVKVSWSTFTNSMTPRHFFNEEVYV